MMPLFLLIKVIIVIIKSRAQLIITFSKVILTVKVKWKQLTGKTITVIIKKVKSYKKNILII